MSEPNGNGRITWRGIGVALLVVVQILFGTLYADLRADVQESRSVTNALPAIYERLARLEERANAIDTRTARMEGKLDQALDTPAVRVRPGPR